MWRCPKSGGYPKVIIQNWLSVGKTMVWRTHSLGNLSITWLIIGIYGDLVAVSRLPPKAKIDL